MKPNQVYIRQSGDPLRLWYKFQLIERVQPNGTWSCYYWHTETSTKRSSSVNESDYWWVHYKRVGGIHYLNKEARV